MRAYRTYRRMRAWRVAKPMLMLTVAVHMALLTVTPEVPNSGITQVQFSATTQAQAQAQAMRQLRSLALRVQTAETLRLGRTTHRQFKDEDSMAVIQATEGQRTSFLQQELSAMQRLGDFPSAFSLPVRPMYKSRGFAVEGCRAFATRTESYVLLLELLPATVASDIARTQDCDMHTSESTAAPLVVLYKPSSAVDAAEIHREVATASMIQLLDRTWMRNGLDLVLLQGQSVGTAEGELLAEVTRPDALTMMQIYAQPPCSVDRPETSRGMCQLPRRPAGLRTDFLASWLRRQQTCAIAELQCLQRYVLSNARAAVLHYLLRFRDRHLSNILLDPDGTVFHIDFTSTLFSDDHMDLVCIPLSEAQLHVIGGRNSSLVSQLIDTATEAFQILRREPGIVDALAWLVESAPGTSRQDGAVQRELLGLLHLDETEQQAKAFFEHTILGSIEAHTCCCCSPGMFNWNSDLPILA